MSTGDTITVYVILFGFAQAIFHIVMTAWHGLKSHELHAFAHFGGCVVHLLCVNLLIHHLKKVLT